MLFVTNRTPEQSVRTRLNRKISFDLQNTTVSQNLFFCQRHSKGNYTEVGSAAFFDKLKDLPRDTQILLYIHGFNNTAEETVFPMAQDLQRLVNRRPNKDMVYVVPIIWPCDDDSFLAIVDDYWDDQRAADMSGIAFSRLLGKFDGWRRSQAQLKDPCAKRINLLAHSMGNRVLRNTLQEWSQRDGGHEMPQLFRNIFMVAADVVNHTLEADREGSLIAQAARNVVVYYANDDLAMPASKIVNVKNRVVSRRLGMTGPKDLDAVPKNVFEADCDDFNNTFDRPKGHTYFTQHRPTRTISPVMKHMTHAIRYGRVEPAERSIVLKRPGNLKR